MIIGHTLLAFIIVAGISLYLGHGRQNAMALGVLAGFFAILPDIDMLYAAKEILVIFSSGVFQFADSFWAASSVTHRGMTHSLVIGILGASVFGINYLFRNRYLAGATVLMFAGLGYVLQGPVTMGIMTLFGTLGVGASYYFKQGFSPYKFFGAALFGLVSHPFGDLFTGTPPALLYPFEVPLFTGRIALAADPVLNLLLIFGLETLLFGGAVFTALRLYDQRFLEYLHPVSVLGVAFATAVILLPPPTLSMSYPFVFAIIGFGAANSFVVPAFPGRGITRDRNGVFLVSVNLIASVLLAYASYILAYMVLL